MAPKERVPEYGESQIVKPGPKP